MKLSKTVLPIMKEAAKIILSAHDLEKKNAVSVKPGDANFVTIYDKATQDFLIEKLTEAIPEAQFVAEEQENDFSVLSGEYVFVIDPIDGTTNFIHEFSHSSISVACVSHGETVFGAVYNPYLDEMFYAEKGCGAFRNGDRISVSDRPEEQALCIFGSSPYYKDEFGEKNFSLLHKIFMRTADVRRLASAAIDLCYIACGRAEMFFELRLSPWDYLAGALIVKEAGGIISDINGSPLSMSEPCSVFAANSACYEALMKAAREL